MQRERLVAIILITVIFVSLVYVFYPKIRVTAYQRPAPPDGYGDINGDGYVTYDTGSSAYKHDFWLLYAFIDEYGPWDVNEDGIANTTDISEITKSWTGSVSYVMNLSHQRVDINWDSRVDVMDVWYVLQFWNETKTEPLTQERINLIKSHLNVDMLSPDEIIYRGDVDGDGELTEYDVYLIIQYAMGAIDKFPVETQVNETIFFMCPDNDEKSCDGYIHTYDLGDNYYIYCIVVDIDLEIKYQTFDILYLKISPDGNNWTKAYQWIINSDTNKVYGTTQINKKARYIRYELNSKWVTEFISSKGYALVKVAGGLPPVAQLDKTVYYATSGDTVTFDASASYDPDGYITGYRFIIKSGDVIVVDSGWITSPIYSYKFVTTTDKTYSLTLVVMDNDGLTANATASISIRGVNHAPVIVLSQNEYHINKLPATITFDASNSYDPDGEPLQFRWKVFGFYDTEWGDYPTFTYTFDEKTWAFIDMWYVYVYARDGSGGTESAIITVYFDVNVTVNINLTWTPAKPYVGDTVVFDASRSYVEGVNMTITDYAFVIDGNFYGWYKTPYKRYTFKFAGYHTVEVRVMLDGNRIISGVDNIWNVYISPYYDTEAIIVSGDMVSGKPVYVQVVSPNLIKRVEVWFGDGFYDSKDDVSSVSYTFTHTYAISGVYTVNAKIYDYNNNVVTVSKSIRIYSPEDFEEKEKILAWIIVAGITIPIAIVGYVAYRRWKR